MRFLSFWASVILFISTHAFAQSDFSNKGLMDIKEKSESLRTAWMKAFDDAVQSKNFSALAPLRSENEKFLDDNLSSLSRLYAHGDARALLTAVDNYLQIEKQFVRSVMIPAEKLGPDDKQGVDDIYKKINNFGQKEKIFLIDINNALVMEGNRGASASPAPSEEEKEEEFFEYEEQRGSMIEERQRKHPTKEDSEDDGKKHRKRKRHRRAAGNE